MCESAFVGCFLCEAEGICGCVWEGVYVSLGAGVYICIVGRYVCAPGFGSWMCFHFQIVYGQIQTGTILI